MLTSNSNNNDIKVIQLDIWGASVAARRQRASAQQQFTNCSDGFTTATTTTTTDSRRRTTQDERGRTRREDRRRTTNDERQQNDDERRTTTKRQRTTTKNNDNNAVQANTFIQRCPSRTLLTQAPLAAVSSQLTTVDDLSLALLHPKPDLSVYRNTLHSSAVVAPAAGKEGRSLTLFGFHSGNGGGLARIPRRAAVSDCE